jgi:hypothetical protein
MSEGIENPYSERRLQVLMNRFIGFFNEIQKPIGVDAISTRYLGQACSKENRGRTSVRMLTDYLSSMINKSGRALATEIYI